MKQLNPDHIKRYVCRLLPIPYVTKYKDSIHVTKCDDPERIASQFADIKEVFKLEMCIIFGFYFFEEIPSIHTLSGAAFIVVSSAIIFIRENQLKKPIILPRQQ